jgi:hypothetical protein
VGLCCDEGLPGLLVGVGQALQEGLWLGPWLLGAWAWGDDCGEHVWGCFWGWCSALLAFYSCWVCLRAGRCEDGWFECIWVLFV